MERSLVLAVDGGGSGTRAVLFDGDGNMLARDEGGPGNLWRHPRSVAETVRRLWRSLCDRVGLDEEGVRGSTVLSAGMAGCGDPRAVAAFRSALPDFAVVHLSSDLWCAYAGTFGGGPGTLLRVGTGSILGKRDRHGCWHVRGGFGFPAGDGGSGAWLGLRLCSEWLAGREGIGVRLDPRIVRHLEDRIGTRREAILDWLRDADAGRFASLVPCIVEEARRGDPFCRALLEEAAEELAALVHGAGGPDGSLAIGGGLAPVFRPLLAARFGADAVFEADALDPIRGALRIARGELAAEHGEGKR